MRIALLSDCPPLGLKVLYCLAMAGHWVAVISLRQGSRLKNSRYRSEYLEIPDEGLERQASVIKEYCGRKGIGMVLGDSISSAGRLHELQGLLAPGLAYAPESTERLSRIHDKWTFYSDFREFFPMPRTNLLSAWEEIGEDLLEHVGRPFLVKPREAESGHGVKVLNGADELRSYLAEPGPHKELPVILQQYVPGEDIGFSVLAENGRVLVWDTQRHGDGDVREFFALEEARRVGFELVRHMSYSGPAHIDMRRDPETGTVYALECNCRFWFTVTANAWTGINYPDLAARRHGSQIMESSFPGPLESTYFLPSTLLRKMKRPWGLSGVTRNNWRGLWQAVSDPLPHLLSH